MANPLPPHDDMSLQAPRTLTDAEVGEVAGGIFPLVVAIVIVAIAVGSVVAAHSQK
jgi:lactobin A/cerein 7B family class IIb bacteriocin